QAQPCAWISDGETARRGGRLRSGAGAILEKATTDVWCGQRSRIKIGRVQVRPRHQSRLGPGIREGQPSQTHLHVKIPAPLHILKSELVAIRRADVAAPGAKVKSPGHNGVTASNGRVA